VSRPEERFDTMKARPSQSILVDLLFLARATPSTAEALPKWIAELQSMHAAYLRAERRVKRDGGEGITEGVQASGGIGP
jgi:hypothetical protein